MSKSAVKTDKLEKLGLQPLKITCTSSDCDNGLHCFRQKHKAAALFRVCRACGADLVDWQRVHQKDELDVDYTITALKYERIRHHFWHKEIDEKAVSHARRKGKSGMRVAAEKRIRQSVGAAQPTYDGRQTPMEGNALYYAQHATATCCRKCIEEWHNVPQDRELSEGEVTYLAHLVTRFVEERLPQLTEDGEKIPPRRRKAVIEETPALGDLVSEEGES